MAISKIQNISKEELTSKAQIEEGIYSYLRVQKGQPLECT